MVNVPEHIDYWKMSSDEDFAAAESLLDEGYLRHGLFFAHLAVEKMLKAHVTKKTNEVPPRIHNLIRLAEIAELTLESEQMRFLRGFDMYQLEGRYPDSAHIITDANSAKEKLAQAGEMLKWLKTQF